MAREPLHWSQLKTIARSPAHYRHAIAHPFAATASMRLGTACHALVLGVSHPIACFEGGSRRGKAWDAFEAETLAADPRTTIMLASEMTTARAMADAVRACPDAMAALDGAHERELEWSIAGRACAGRLDSIGARSLCDLKSTADASPVRFPWQARKLEYAAQLGWYYDGALAAGLPTPWKVSIVAVESAPPHCVVVYDLSDEMLEMGRRRARVLLEQLLTCESSDEWPGYAQGPIVLDVMESAEDGPGLDFGDADSDTGEAT